MVVDICLMSDISGWLMLVDICLMLVDICLMLIDICLMFLDIYLIVVCYKLQSDTKETFLFEHSTETYITRQTAYFILIKSK